MIASGWKLFLRAFFFAFLLVCFFFAVLFLLVAAFAFASAFAALVSLSQWCPCWLRSSRRAAARWKSPAQTTHRLLLFPADKDAGEVFLEMATGRWAA